MGRSITIVLLCSFAAVVFALGAPEAELNNLVLVALPCDESDSGQKWTYTENAFLSHVATGLALVATGKETDTAVSFPVLQQTPQMEPAQWMYNTSSKELHAFRNNGNRCLMLGNCDCPSSPAIVAMCDGGQPGLPLGDEEIFPTFFPDLDPHSQKQGFIK